ncbi:MAG: hypothetical protein JWO18_2131, partial [Microbacteriaceae bacterium]|nr:hypothetical protein [Microbacteriaceae bacterium]
AMMLATGESLVQAVEIAVASGSFVVRRAGVQSSYPMRADVIPTAATLAEHEISLQN